MKIKTYTAPTMSEAMDLLRHELGENALIVSTQRLGSGNGVRLTAAIEETALEEEFNLFYNETPYETEFQKAVRETLTYHALPSALIEKILLYVKEANKKNNLVAFASALDTVFDFHPLPEQIKGQAFMLTGAAGAGKTVMPQNLHSHIQALKKTCDLIFIDMPAFNPFQQSDMDYLTAYIEAADALPVLVMPAGVDPQESMETAEAFAEAGVIYLLATRLDAARRFGGVLAAAHAGHLTLCEASMSQNITRGLSAINAVSLARLLLMSSEESDSVTKEKS